MGPEKYSEEWLKKKTLVQNDGGEKFTVENITDSSGTFKKKIVKLKSLKDQHTVTKNFIELINYIKTPGSPWSIEK